MWRRLLQTIPNGVSQSDLGGGEAAKGSAVSLVRKLGRYVIQKQREIAYAHIVQGRHLGRECVHVVFVGVAKRQAGADGKNEGDIS